MSQQFHNDNFELFNCLKRNCHCLDGFITVIETTSHSQFIPSQALKHKHINPFLKVFQKGNIRLSLSCSSLHDYTDRSHIYIYLYLIRFLPFPPCPSPCVILLPSNKKSIHYTVTTPVYHLVKTLCLQFSANASFVCVCVYVCVCVCVCFPACKQGATVTHLKHSFGQCKFTEPCNLSVMNTTSLPLDCHAFHSV